MNSNTITELAQEFRITTRTLRFYEEKGLLSPSREGGKRVYNHKDRTHLKLILRGKSLGFSLEESRDIILMYDPETKNQKQMKALQSKIQEKLVLLQRQQEELTAMTADLEDWEKRCSNELAQLQAKNSV